MAMYTNAPFLSLLRLCSAVVPPEWWEPQRRINNPNYYSYPNSKTLCALNRGYKSISYNVRIELYTLIKPLRVRCKSVGRAGNPL